MDKVRPLRIRPKIMYPLDEERTHWKPLIINIRAYVGSDFINMTEDEIEDYFWNLLFKEGYRLDSARDYDLSITEEER